MIVVGAQLNVFIKIAFLFYTIYLDVHIGIVLFILIHVSYQFGMMTLLKDSRGVSQNHQF